MKFVGFGLALALAAGGCGGGGLSKTAPLTEIDRAPPCADLAALAGLAARREAPLAALRVGFRLRRTYVFRADGHRESLSVEGTARLSGTARFRLALTKFGLRPLDLVVRDGRCEALVDALNQDPVVREGDLAGLSADDLAKNGIPIPPELTGRQLLFPAVAAAPDETAQFAAAPDGYRVEYRAAAAAAAAASPRRIIRADREFGLVRQIEYFRADGSLMLRLNYENYAVCLLQPPEMEEATTGTPAGPPGTPPVKPDDSPGAPGVLVVESAPPPPQRIPCPLLIRVYIPKADREVQAEVEVQRLDPRREPMPEREFVLQIPPGTPREPLIRPPESPAGGG